MGYASLKDLEVRLGRTLGDDERGVAQMLLEDAGALVDSVAPRACPDNKKVVCCRMVLRVIDGNREAGYPVGATQGSMTGLGYTQYWAISSGGTAGELYLSKSDRRTLGLGDRIGAGSPVETLTGGVRLCLEA